MSTIESGAASGRIAEANNAEGSPPERDAGFADWIDAEAAAYGAVHLLHQRTCGGRLKASSADIEEIARLRREADARFAVLRGVPEAIGAEGSMTVARQSFRVPAHRSICRKPSQDQVQRFRNA